MLTGPRRINATIFEDRNAAPVQHLVIGDFSVNETTRPTVNLRDEARDKITGFAGIVIAITDWLNGCRRVTIQPRELRDGKPIDTFTFDVEQIRDGKPIATFTFDVEQIEAVAEKAEPEMTPSGGPCPDPIRVRVPSR